MEQSIENVSAALSAFLAANLSEWIGASWAVAISTFGRTLYPAAICGTVPDLQICLEHVVKFLAAGGPFTERLEGSSATDAADSARPCALVPIRVRNQTLGVFALGPKKETCAYTEADRQLMADAAAQLSALLERETLASLITAKLAEAQRTRANLKAARDMQNRFLPGHLLPVRGLDYGGESRPAGDLGGDFFDFVRPSNNALALSIGEITGATLGAAIMMSGLQMFLRTLTVHLDPDIASTVQELNRTFYELSPKDVYATLFYARLDPLWRQVTYTNAGHEPALLVRARTGRVQRLEHTGSVLGLSRRAAYGSRTVLLEPGDVLVAFTDGISGAMDSQGRELCETGIVEIIQRHLHASASDLAAHIMEAVDAFTDLARFADDRTVAVARLTAAAETRLCEDYAAVPACAAG